MNKKTVLLTFILFAAIFLAGCTEGAGTAGASANFYIRPGKTEPAPVKKACLIGYISDLDDRQLFFDRENGFGMPIEKASISLSPLNQQAISETIETSTGLSGKFTIEDLDPGVYMVTASKEGYKPVTVAITITGLTADVVIPTTRPLPIHGPAPFIAGANNETIEISLDSAGKDIYVLAGIKNRTEGVASHIVDSLSDPTRFFLNGLSPQDNIPVIDYSIDVFENPITPNAAYNTAKQQSVSADPHVIKRHDILPRLEEGLLLSDQTILQKNTGKVITSCEIGYEWTGIYIKNPDSVQAETVPFIAINTVCVAKSEKADIFLDSDINYNGVVKSKIENYQSHIDRIIANNSNYFADPNDTDGNGKIKIVISAKFAADSFGYFNSCDKYPRSTDSGSPQFYSNEGDIIYLAITENMADEEENQYNFLRTLAHELQHMTLFDARYNMGITESNDVWLNEALSLIAEYYNGYDTNQKNDIGKLLSLGISQPCNISGNPQLFNAPVSLTWWSQNGFYNLPLSALFGRYLVEQYGMGAIKRIYTTPATGIALVEKVTYEDFDSIFDNFSACVVLSGTGVTEDSRYNFSTLNLQELNPMAAEEASAPRKSGFKTCWDDFTIQGANSNFDQPYTLWNLSRYSEHPAAVKIVTNGYSEDSSIKVFAIDKPETP